MASTQKHSVRCIYHWPCITGHSAPRMLLLTVPLARQGTNTLLVSLQACGHGYDIHKPQQGHSELSVSYILCTVPFMERFN